MANRRRTGTLLAVSVVLAWASSATAQGAAQSTQQPNPTGISAQVTKQDQLNVVELVRQALANNNEIDLRRANYTYLERDLGFDDLNPSSSDTYQILLIGGAPYRRHIAHNDRPLPPNEQEDEEAKIKQARDQQFHQEDMKRLGGLTHATYQESELKLPLRLLPDWFDIKMIGEELVDNRQNYVVEATPLKHLKAATEDEHNAQHLVFRIWIDETDTQIRKIEALVTKKGITNPPERIWMYTAPGQEATEMLRKAVATLGLIYEHGTLITEEWRKINNEVWMPSTFFVKGKCHLTSVLGPGNSMQCDHERTYYDYQKFRVDSHILPQ